MLMEKNNNNKLFYEDLFEGATEDTSTYLWAISELSDPEEDYESDHLLLMALAGRARSEMALKMMTADMPSEYHRYKKKLESMRSEADVILNEMVLADSHRIGEILSSDGISHLEKVRKVLLEVRHIAQDGDLFGHSVEDDLYEKASDFIVLFQEIAWTAAELGKAPLSAIDTHAFREKTGDIESLFRRYFGYFNPAGKFLECTRSREYDADHWWLNRFPEADDVQEDEISETFINKLSQAFQSEKQPVAKECAQAENVIAYAFNELDPELNRETREHLLTCGGCFELFMDLRAADAGDGVPEVMPGVFEAIEEMKAIASSEKEEQDLDAMLLITTALSKVNVIRTLLVGSSLVGAFYLQLMKRKSQGRMSAKASKSEPLEIPASFRLSEQSLTNLRKEGIPEQIITELETLKDQKYPDRDKFANALGATIGEKQTLRYKTLILKHADISENFFEMEIGSDDGWLELLSPDMNADKDLLKICEFLEDKTYHWGLLAHEDGWQPLGEVESETGMPLGTDDPEKDILLLCIGLDEVAVSDALGKAVSVLNTPADIGSVSEEPETSLSFVWVCYQVTRSRD